MSVAELFAFSLAVVVLYNAMKAASTGQIDAGGRFVTSLVNRLIDPAVVLVDYPPGHPQRKGA
jgi:hypothetical protein